MKNLLIVIVLLLVLGGVAYFLFESTRSNGVPAERAEELDRSALPEPEEDATPPTETDSIREPEVIAENLEIPWDIAFLPEDEGMLVTLRGGTLLHVERGESYPIAGVRHIGEAGLLGIALHPDFATNRFVYLFQTTEAGDGLENRIVRYRYEEGSLEFDRDIQTGLPGARFHDGGRIEFGPDGMLYIALGDALDEAGAQDPQNLAGSILRVTENGEVPADNPFGNAVYSYGHRNPQGLAWDEEGRLWSTEHGRSGPFNTGYDEVNLIVAGGNYGWPESEGDTVLEGTIAPSRHSTASKTWAPASLAFLDDSLFFGGLRGEALYEARLAGAGITEFVEHFTGEFGRIRTVRVGPDGFLYLTTSNRDGRGSPSDSDDKIIRIDPRSL